MKGLPIRVLSILLYIQCGWTQEEDIMDLSEQEGFQYDGRNLGDIDWCEIDRRVEENWSHLYPFGERYQDVDILGRPWNDQQVDLDFFMPYYGFRYNYSFLFPEGYIAFSDGAFLQQPYTFPTPGWPDTPDPAIIAAFLSPQNSMSVGETSISHTWYRIISRDLRKGMVGARGFTADYAMIVTWERMAYGGSPRATRLNLYEQVKRWQNTYQLVMLSDEIRSYVMLNYANINWTSSTSSGAFSGRGGMQSAIVGFNGGNATGFMELPYSAEGNSYKLVQFGSTLTAGRWQARVDESPIYGGCINTSAGTVHPHTPYIPMLGGFALNVSGPCFRRNQVIMLQLEEVTMDCVRIDMVVARCVIPVHSIFRSGQVDLKLSIDGGKNYPWWNKVYMLRPDVTRPGGSVRLLNDPIKPHDNWRSAQAENLTLRWSAHNISGSADRTRNVDITLWGFWEDSEYHTFHEIGAIALNTQNKGVYSFNPRTLASDQMKPDAWRKFAGGVVQVRLSDEWMDTIGDGLYWSYPIPFGWYFRSVWEYEYGSNWAEDLCHEWFDYDGRKINFIRETEQMLPCPCTLDQALTDFGRFTPMENCDMFGNTECPNTRGAKHCVISGAAVWSGAGQSCCYDYEGWLMFSDDYEWNPDYLRFYSAGVPYRAHPWGSFPFKRPPYVPAFSNFYEDLLPYEICCKWAGKCEFYFWRRQTSGCIEFRHSVNGFVYGQGHFHTFDGVKYPFAGQGYFTLAQMKGPDHDLLIQVRMEQPPKTLWDTDVPATVVTGIAMRDNGSDTIQVFARKEFRRERYRMDVFVNGNRVFFDLPIKKVQQFGGVTVRSPLRNMNTSELWIIFKTGVGVRVEEARGQLSIAVALPHNYNQTEIRGRGDDRFEVAGTCGPYVRTMGLLGTFNGDPRDEMMGPECNAIQRGMGKITESERLTIYNNFGLKWRVDANKMSLLFQSKFKPLYNPLTFGDKSYLPQFTLYPTRLDSEYSSLVFSDEQVRSTCHGLETCIYDYVTSGRREIGLLTMSLEQKFQGFKERGERKLISCGNLMKNKGVIKFPPGNHYLDGVTVSFQCQPEFFRHGAETRTCRNGTWSPGWWAWCRERSVEDGLKWFTGIIVSLLILGLIVAIFVYCYCLRIKAFRANQYYYSGPQKRPELSQRDTKAAFPVTESESSHPTIPVTIASHRDSQGHYSSATPTTPNRGGPFQNAGDSYSNTEPVMFSETGI